MTHYIQSKGASFTNMVYITIESGNNVFDTTP